jgi:aspartate 1-decarboxylase
VNGAAAHLIGAGEEVIIMGFELASAPVTPQVVLVTSRDNRSFEPLHEAAGMKV